MNEPPHKWRDPTISFQKEEIKPMKGSPEDIRQARVNMMWTIIIASTLWAIASIATY